MKKKNYKYHFTLFKESLSPIADTPELYILNLTLLLKDFNNLKEKLSTYLLLLIKKMKSNHHEYFILALQNIKNLNNSNHSKSHKISEFQCLSKRECCLKGKLRPKKCKEQNKELLNNLVWTLV